MNFDHYNHQCVDVAVDLVNSLGSLTGNEYLPDPEAVRAFIADHDFESPASVDAGDVTALHELRDKLRAVFEADEADRVGFLNDLIAEVRTLPQVVDHDGEGWHLHYVPSDAPLADRVQSVTAMALANVICFSGSERLGICAAERCRDVFVDTSKNRSRRYCNETCASRANVAAFRARRKAANK